MSLVIDAVFKSSKLRKCWKFVLQPYHFTLSLNYFARHPASVRNTFASLSHCWSQPPSLPPPPNSVLRALGESPKDCVGYGSKVHPPSFRPISHTQVVSTFISHYQSERMVLWEGAWRSLPLAALLCRKIPFVLFMTGRPLASLGTHAPPPGILLPLCEHVCL